MGRFCYERREATCFFKVQEGKFSFVSSHEMVVKRFETRHLALIVVFSFVNRATAVTLEAFLDSMLKIADAATSSKGKFKAK